MADIIGPPGQFGRETLLKEVILEGRTAVIPYVAIDGTISSGGGGGGSSNTTEATQLAVKAAVEGVNTKLAAALPLPTGAATAALQTTALTNWTSLLNSIPTLMGTREYNYAEGRRSAVGATASAFATIGTLNASREVMINASVRCFIKWGTAASTVPAIANVDLLPVEPGGLFHTRVPAGATHFSVIRDTADGFARIVPVL